MIKDMIFDDSTKWIISILVGYLFGTIAWGLIIAKIKGVNLRAIGSGNIGGTNVSRALGGKWGLFVILMDAMKAFIAALIIKHVFGFEGMFIVVAALAAIIGHCYPVWLKFKGGKGAATILGFSIVVLPWWLILGGLVTIIAIFKLSKIVSIISLIGGMIVIAGGIINQSTFIGEKVEYLWAFCLGAFAILVWRHRSNISRLAKGKENSLNKK